MVDLAAAFSEVKSMPDHILEGELKSPTGKFPGWLALGEIHERKRLRATHGVVQPQRKSMAEEYAGSAQPAFAGAGMQQQPPPSPQQPMPPQAQGLGSLPQQTPQGYASGGIVSLARGGPVFRYANKDAIRKYPLTSTMEAHLTDAVQNVYGPGYTAEIFSGGQRGEDRVGTHRHDDKGQGGRAGDVRFFDPEGRQLVGDRLAPIGQYWAAKKYGGVGMEMHGGGVHLDELTPEQSGGGWNWNYADKGGQYTKAQQAAIEAGLRGELPSLYGGGEGGGGNENYRRAFLDTIASGESSGDNPYRQMYGGRHFEDYSQHPGIGHTILSGPNQGEQSSAAGRYQFLKGTWEEQAKKYGYKDFSPENQDLAAWNYANDVYKAKTGGDLASVLQSGDTDKIANVGKVLSGTWTSLPGGIEQSTGTNQFVATYQRALGNPSQAVAASAADTAAKMTVAENDAAPGTVQANDPISQYMMATTLMGGKGSKPSAPPPAAAPQKVAVAVDPLQFIQDPTQREALRRRQTYGLA